MNRLRVITHPVRSKLVAVPGTWLLVLALLAAAGNSQAANPTWTNTTSDVWQSPTAWDTAPAFPAPGDTVNFTNPATYSVALNSDVSDLTTLFFDNTVGTQILTLNLGTNSLTVVGNGTSPGPFYVGGQAGGATAIVYLVSSTGAGKGLFVTNSSNNSKFVIGRNNPGRLFVTNGNVTANNLALGSSTAGIGVLVLSGSNTFWSNSGSIGMGNSSTSYGCTLVVSNSASMTCGGAFKLGFGITASSGVVLLDSGGRLFTTAAGTAVGGTPVSTNNTATIQGGSVWDNGGKDFTVGSATFATNNTLVIGTGSSVSNNSVVVISAGNSLNLQGGVLQTSGTVTNSGTIKGFGSIAGNTIVPSGGLLAPGNGTAVGQIAFSNNLTLASGSKTLLKLDKSQGASNDSVSFFGTTTYGGTLTVTNVGPTLTGGDTFQVFAAGAFATDFAITNLPPLSPSVSWDTSQMHSQGVISVVFLPVPPGIVNLTNQAVNIGASVTISATVTGIPTPTLQWQENGTNIANTSSTVSIPNAQTGDSGTYCLIASNVAGVVTNCMTLTVSSNDVPPTITGPTDQSVILGHTGTFSAAVSGIPTPTVQWLENGTNIVGATSNPLVLTNVQYSQNGFLYSVVASNRAGVATSSNATLFVLLPPTISAQPQNTVATNLQSASLSVTASGVPAPIYQWYKNSIIISSVGNPTATNATFTIGSVAPTDAGTYSVVVSNVAGVATSSNATLTVYSPMAATTQPTNGSTGICYDTPLYLNFTQLPVLKKVGQIRIYNMTNSVTPVDTIDLTANFDNPNVANSATNIAQNIQARAIAGDTFNTFPVIITGNTAAIYPHLDVLNPNQTYYVTVDAGCFTDTNGANYAGISGTNAWRFSTKPTGPANPTNLVVAADNSGDFLTVQGAVDSLPANNTTHTLINIRNGTYREIVNVHSKNNITFRGQSRLGTLVGYPNNANVAPGATTHLRMAFKVNANDIALENLNLVNMTPKGGSQAEALMLETAIRRFIFFNCEVDSFQDTILGNTSGTQAYFQDNLIQGDVDYIWGGMNAFFTNCELRTRTSPANLIQPRTDATSNGMSFVNCQLTRTSNTVTSIGLARALGFGDGNVIYANCQIDASGFAGWNAQDLIDNPNLRWWEYNNSNLTSTASVTFNGTQLTNGDPRVTLALSATNWLYGWVPQLAPNITNQPVSLVVTTGQAAAFSVGATGIPYPAYQWLKAGTNLVTATSATLSFANAQAGDAGTYSVIVSNVAGTLASTNVTLIVIGPPTASFTASPTNGVEPLVVTFTDTSSGSPLSISWNLGDSTSTNTGGGASFGHAYTAGVYTVTLIASNTAGLGSVTQSNLITVITAFQSWQQQYFGCTNCPQAAASADPDGDGQNNQAEFLAGTDPTNGASGFRILSTVRQGNDIAIIWTAAGGRTNAVQATTGGVGGSYATNFADVSGPVVLPGSGSVTTNYVDSGGASNGPVRYYRVRLVP
ncbi:MAG TPA: pectinesterase family protein [Verrucomicrobiae bacterium]|nr:pectinesterase family protein [Verrucomicrobiae bacterium]